LVDLVLHTSFEHVAPLSSIFQVDGFVVDLESDLAGLLVEPHVHWRYRLLLESEGSEDGGSCLGAVRLGVDVGSALHLQVFLLVPEQNQLSFDVHGLPDSVNGLEVRVSVGHAYFGSFVHADLFDGPRLVLAVTIWTLAIFLVRNWQYVVLHVVEHRASVALERFVVVFPVVHEVLVADLVALLAVAGVGSGFALGVEPAHVASGARVGLESAFFSRARALAAVLSRVVLRWVRLDLADVGSLLLGAVCAVVVQGKHSAFGPQVVLEGNQLVVGTRTLHGFDEIVSPLPVERSLLLWDRIVLDSLFSDDWLAYQWCLFACFGESEDLIAARRHNTEDDRQ